jgi:hypothetical protein
MIEFFFLGGMFSMFRFNKYIETLYNKSIYTVSTDTSKQYLHRSELFVLHMHIMVYTLMVVVMFMYLSILASAFMVFFKFEKPGANLLTAVIKSHSMLNKISGQFLYSMVCIFSLSTMVHALFVMIFMISHKFKPIDNRHRAKFEMILSSLVSFITISLIIIYVI